MNTDILVFVLEEWLDYLRSGHIRDDTTAPGLQEARKQLQYMQMPREEQISYDRHLDAIMIQNDVISTAQKEGRAEGIAIGKAEGKAEGRAEGRAEEKLANARALKNNGVPLDIIARSLGLTNEQMKEL